MLLPNYEYNTEFRSVFSYAPIDKCKLTVRTILGAFVEENNIDYSTCSFDEIHSIMKTID